MYEHAWYSFVPESTSRKDNSSAPQRGHRRKESLLQQPNESSNGIVAAEPLQDVYEELDPPSTPPEPEVIRRAASYSDFYHVFRAQLDSDGQLKRGKRSFLKNRSLEALMLGGPCTGQEDSEEKDLALFEAPDDFFLEASQRDYLLYREQLQLTERHLHGLIDDANCTLKMLSSLSDSFQAVETQTASFRAKCDDLLNEQKRLEKLADEVGTDLYYYAYLETATRRLNAPGVGRLVDHPDFGEMMDNLDACIVFMEEHETYRDRDSYLARYNSLLTKAVHVLDHGFTSRLEKTSTEIGRQITATKSESARHALAYGRFEEMMLDSYSFFPNIRKVVLHVYDQWGRPVQPSSNASIYTSSAENLFHTYFTTRDMELKVVVQHDIEEYQNEVKSLSLETASRNFIKQCFERLYNEENLFSKLFGVEPTWNKSPHSAFDTLKAIHTSMAHPGHLGPIAARVQSVLQNAQLETTCDVMGWLANAYSTADSDDEESPFFRKCLEYAAQLLVEHLWPFTDNAFEAEILKSISKAALPDSSLTMRPVDGGVAYSGAHPLVNRALELLVMYDRAMPKERSSKNSSVVFKIVRETIQVLQRAEARIKQLKNETDSDLFMVKNLLIIRNELVSLEIGDIRSQEPSMQHFSRIWDTLSPTNWVGFFSNILLNTAGSTLWSRSTASTAVTAKTLTVQDMSEQLDELLRQSIYAFTKRWGAMTNDARSRKPGARPIAKVEAALDDMLSAAFRDQPEVVEKLREAIEANAKAQDDARDSEQAVSQS